MKTLFALIGAIVWIICSALLNGWVFQTLWGWFVVPLGIMAIGLAHAIGLSTIIRYVVYQFSKQASDDTIHQVLISVLYPLVALLLGYVAHLYM